MSTVVFPGQGAQHKGMGTELFEEFTDLTVIADQVLGYSIRDLCVEDAGNCLNLTQFTQPALYTVNAFHYFHHLKNHPKPNVLAGHSLGEYCALLAAGAFDFKMGLKLVQKRGELMSQAQNGGMLAVIRTTQQQVEQILSQHQLDAIDVANYNSPSQLVLSGEAADVVLAQKAFDSEGVFCIPLKVSGAFHSRLMKQAARAYQEFLSDFEFLPLKIPVIANVTGLPYHDDQIKTMLVQQLCSSVQWTNTVRYLMGVNQADVIEVGPGQVLSKLTEEIKNNAEPLILSVPQATELIIEKPTTKAGSPIVLGSKSFLKEYGVKYPYVAGSMCHGISSDQLVIKMAQSGFLAFLGSVGLSLTATENLIKSCQKALQPNQSFGVNIHFSPNTLSHQQQLIDLCLRYQVNCIEVSGFDHISLDLIKYRAKGLSRSADQVIAKHKILLKTSKSESAEMFMQAAPKHMLNKLLADQLITEEQHELAQQVAVADDICVEGDSGWKTEQASTLVKLPEIIRLRNKYSQTYSPMVRIGSSGGLGTPDAIAAVFMLGADFVLTGSINQCTVEANVSEHVKQLLTGLTSEDTCCVPAGDLFESGARAQVVRKGLYFPARAQKLYDLYRLNNGLDDLSHKEKQQIEQHFMHRSIETVLQEIIDTESSQEIQKINENDKYKMAKVFKWYFEHAQKSTLNGQQQDQDNYQIYCGPALGAFNQWVSGTELESLQNRHVDDIALRLLSAAAEFFKPEAQAA